MDHNMNVLARLRMCYQHAEQNQAVPGDILSTQALWANE